MLICFVKRQRLVPFDNPVWVVKQPNYIVSRSSSCAARLIEFGCRTHYIVTASISSQTVKPQHYGYNETDFTHTVPRFLYFKYKFKLQQMPPDMRLQKIPSFSVGKKQTLKIKSVCLFVFLATEKTKFDLVVILKLLVIVYKRKTQSLQMQNTKSCS